MIMQKLLVWTFTTVVSVNLYHFNKYSETGQKFDPSSIVFPQDPLLNYNCNSNQRISEQKCKEYQFMGLREEDIPYAKGLKKLPKQSCFQIYRCIVSYDCILGGTNAVEGEFPHMVAIGYENLDNELSFDCGGSLISEIFVLTAAHCKYSTRTEASVVRVGVLNLRQEDELPELDIPIASFINHERYDRVNRKNDIAVIRLARDVEFSLYVRPACLMTKNIFPQNKAVASGWGFTDHYNTQRADRLQKVELPLIGYRECNRLYYNLDSTQLCAGSENGGVDTCTGDSGGPLQIISKETSCLSTIVGVTSFGSKYCGDIGVYTKVSAYIDWIEQKVWRF